ncbi:MAG TPA: flavodoxin-dependent (E)-4-hydroxy-3-methylbut-2-enyl-diphosphate synthase [bacterium]|nr:flavodoxin-dependent (E)-4-hydroxy-3-methylbut-2-enyl-diphosphate synthase [bacterium]HPP02868.1 flavodoxin-dependent (E)-4-hydroxy-3-methylbut-2-enyl-diphosphate synthase [bacterium]HXK92813.1 flavodoxin-dependent (E)-4-hydroxy-3-methylbut-2-enyl-diphosphate synthase [bacterium]
MSLFSVNLKVAAQPERAEELKRTISPTLCDGYEPLPSSASLPINELRWSSFDDILPYLQNDHPITARKILLDLRGFGNTFPRLIVYLSPILYRWTGQELSVILPDDDYKYTLPALGDLLRSLELRSKGIRIISCPTCARCRTDFPEMVRSIESHLHAIDKPLDVAIMGCEVNGPGEAKAADIGIAFGDQKGMLFKNGEKVRVVTIEEAASVLLDELAKM